MRKKILIITILIFIFNNLLKSNEWYNIINDRYQFNTIFVDKFNNVLFGGNDYIFVNDWNTIKARYSTGGHNFYIDIKYFNKRYYCSTSRMHIIVLDSNQNSINILISGKNGIFNTRHINKLAILNRSLWLASDSLAAKYPDIDSIDYQLLKDTNWVNFTRSNSPLPSNNVVLIDANSKNNDVWMVADSSGQRTALRYNNGTWNTFRANNSGLPQDSITCISIDSTNNIWFGTGQGLAKLSPNLQNWYVYTTNNSGLPSNKISALTVDKSGTVWIGTNQAITKYDGTNWTSYSNTDMLQGDVKCIAVDTFNNKWILSQSNITMFREGGVIGNVKLIDPDTNRTHVDENNLNENNVNISDISPNPASDYIEINVGALHAVPLPNTIEIFNIFGEKNPTPALPVWQGAGKVLPNGEDLGGVFRIDITNLAPGVYFIKIGDKFEKFVKL